MAVSLVLGDFDLIHVGSAYETSVLAEGTSRGVPVPIEVAVKSWLQDGAIVVTQGYDNREVRVRVRFHGDDLQALAEAEAALFAELGKPNTLTWTPPDGSPASVFVVVTSSLEAEDDDLGEIDSDPYRTYSVRLVCEAFVRSASETVAAALATSGTTTTLVDNGSATTNWTGAVDSVSTAPSVVSGAVGITTSALLGSVTVTLTRTASISTSATPYLVVDWSATAGTSAGLRAFGDGTELTKIGEAPSPTAGYTRSWFLAAASTVGVLRLDSASAAFNPLVTQSRSLYVDNINRTDIAPSIGTARQLIRSFPVDGSAPSPGSFAIEHATTSLGDVLAYFWSDDSRGNSPPCRQFRTGGPSVTTDATMVSGAREVISSGTTTFEIPASRMFAGRHLLMARLACANLVAPQAIVTYTATTVVGGTDVGVTVTGTTTLTLSTTYGIYALGRLQLPTRDLDVATGGVVRVTITAAGTATTTMDEAWLFSAAGQLVQVACGSGAAASGGPAKRVFLEPATPFQPRPTVRIGHAANKSDSFYPADFRSWQFPYFKPPRMSVLTVTTNATDASGTYRAFDRWHTHAAR